MQNIINFTIPPKFWSHYDKVIKKLTSCKNTFYVNESDKKGLVHEATPLERNHLRYLLMYDNDIKEIMKNKAGVTVYMKLFLFAFGLF